MRRIMQKQIFIFGLVMLMAGCALGSSTKYIRIYFPDGDSINAELAITVEQRIRGLMFREKLNSDQGMLFVFEEENIQSFWMKNCLISLDIIWLDKDKRIIHIETAVPPCFEKDCPSYGPAIPVLYVLELKSGSVEERKIKLYDKIDFILTRNKIIKFSSSVF